VNAVGQVVLCGLRDREIDPAEVLRAVGAGSSGGTTLFVGTVRDHDEGRQVRELGYTAHPDAGQVLAAVAEQVAADFPGVRLAALHRTGDLAVGDVAVAVAAAAGHRADAFEASRRLIDDLKAQVPIWKRQVFADGSAEWVGLGSELPS
jgi:molybdopterin synthase catalytic subunit